LDVEYYRDLEMWVRSHSRSLKLVPFESLGDWATVWWKNCDDMLSRLHLIPERHGQTDRQICYIKN